MDPRQVRSRKALHEALITLMRQHDFDAIQIVEITEQADLAISTFYRHYANKQELLRDVVDSYVQRVQELRMQSTGGSMSHSRRSLT
ncbi:MAG: TetR/AcrR family transcriptional regulator [Chloroflexota bacterium]